jgi:archaellum component FlaC
MLEKGNKNPAKFFLVLEGLKLTFEVRVGAAKIVLNTLDLASVKDIGKRRELLVQLNMRASDLVSKDDLKKFDTEHTESASPTMQKASVELGEEIDELENQVDNLKIMQRAENYKHTNYNSWDKEFKEWVEKKGYGRYTSFLDEAESGTGLGNEGAKLLADPNSSGIQPKTLEAIKAAHEKGEIPDYTQARKEVIENIINKLLLPRYNKERVAEITKEVNERAAKLAALKKKLQALETN